MADAVADVLVVPGFGIMGSDESAADGSEYTVSHVQCLSLSIGLSFFEVCL